MERVTDDQYAIIDGRVRHVPGGVEEYLRLLDARSEPSRARSGATTTADKPAPGAQKTPSSVIWSQSRADTAAPAGTQSLKRHRTRHALPILSGNP